MKNDKNLVKLGNNIRLLRKSKGLSQEQLALNAHIDRSYIGGIERGERNVTWNVPFSQIFVVIHQYAETPCKKHR